MKTIRKHLESIQDDEIRNRALSSHEDYVTEYPWLKSKEVETLRDALEEGCYWTQDKDSWDYWMKLARMIHRGEL